MSCRGPYRLGVLLAVSGFLASFILTACGGGSPTSTATPTAYSSKAFVVPFDVTPPTWLPTAPTPSGDESNLVTWESPAGTPDGPWRVRFMVPVSVYPPGGNGVVPLPRDYLTYLFTLKDHGYNFAEVTQAHVGGRPATIVTATDLESLDGSIGCSEAGIPADADDCFGIASESVWRLAVIDFADKTLLIWLRLPKTMSPDDRTTKIKSFEKMLTSIRFR